jgi:hypothetical protein
MRLLIIFTALIGIALSGEQASAMTVSEAKDYCQSIGGRWQVTAGGARGCSVCKKSPFGKWKCEYVWCGTNGVCSKITVAEARPGGSIAPPTSPKDGRFQPGILEGGSGLTTQGPAPTGSPLRPSSPTGGPALR